MAAKLEVITTRLTVGALFLIALRMLVVPMTAFMEISLAIHPKRDSHWTRRHTWIKQVVLNVFYVECERACCMDNSLKRWIGFDSFLKSLKFTVRRYAIAGKATALTCHPALQCPQRWQSLIYLWRSLDVHLWYSWPFLPSSLAQTALFNAMLHVIRSSSSYQ